MSAQLLRRPAGELKALADSGSATLGADASAAELIGWVAEHFDVRAAAVASSMANAVLPHLVAQQLPGVDVLFLDTGYHFAETLGTRADVAHRLNVNVVDVEPEQSVAEQDAEHGKDLFARDPSLCCQLRKVAPLARALANYEVWFTGIRREEGPTRTKAPLISWDERHGLVKVNPLAAWSFDELLDYAAVHDVPVNVLLAEGYPSIGCWPCTRPVADGEDPRAGRWAGLAKTECGIHT
ncbi:phosphoadenylyl-sulfate reductase [Arthrobacter monumenti]